jgi:hypothetical protein
MIPKSSNSSRQRQSPTANNIFEEIQDFIANASCAGIPGLGKKDAFWIEYGMILLEERQGRRRLFCR